MQEQKKILRKSRKEINKTVSSRTRDTAATSLSFQPLTYEIESMAGGMYLRMSGMRQSEFN